MGQQVQQLISAWLKDAQRHRRQTITLPPEGILLKPLDVIDWTSSRNGYAGKSFEIGQVGIDTQSLCTTLSLREVDPDDYDWTWATRSLSMRPPWSRWSPRPDSARLHGDRHQHHRRGEHRPPPGDPDELEHAPSGRDRHADAGAGEGHVHRDLQRLDREIDTGSWRLASGVLPETTYQCGRG